MGKYVVFIKKLIFKIKLGATIEGLLASLNKQPNSRFQVWDELTTLVSSFGLYKPG